MKLLTMNLNTYQEDHQLDKFKKLAKTIVNEGIDVICFCEVGQSFMSPTVHHYCREDNAVLLICTYVNELLGCQDYQYVWDISHYGFKIYEEGVAIMSRLPLQDIKSRYVSETHNIFTYKSRKIIKATIALNQQPVDVYACQMGWLDDKEDPFEAQFNNLHQWVSEISSNPVILAGDFSNDVRTKAYKQVINAGYQDAYAIGNPEGMYDETFIYPNGYELTQSPLRLDYVFTKNLSNLVTGAKRLFMDQERISDHIGVMVEFAEA